MAVATVAVGAAPHGLAVSPGGRALYVANSDAATLSVVDTATITVTDTVSLAGTPEGVAVQPDGARVFVANRDASLDAMHVVDASTLGVTPVPLPAATVPVAVTDMTARFAGRVTANGVPVQGALVTASQLGVEVASATTDAAGHYSVFDLDPGTYDLELTAAGYPPFARPAQTVGAGRTSVWIVSLTGDEPAPVADSLSPASAPADGVGFTLSVLGSSFSGSSAIRWNGSVRATTYVSATELRTFIPASDIASPGSAQVTVFTPEPGGGVSAPLQFTIASVPFQLSIDDASVVEGDAGQASAVFTVSLAPARNQTVTVDYSMAPASASDGTTTLADAAAISIPSSGAATPYPSTISVPPLGPISKVTATLSGFSHTWPADVDLLLVGPSGQKVMLMSDVGGSFAVADLALTFDDAGPALTMSALASGTYRPTDEQPGETLPVPAPAGPYGTALSAFIGTDAAGTWSLYVADDAPGYLGSISNGWSLTFTTAGGDYVPTSGTLTFLPGSTSQTVAVAVNGDTDVEPDETFFVNLSGAVNAEILDGQAVGTIINDDTIPPPVLDAVPGGAITVGGTTTLTGTGFTAGTVIKLFVNMGASIDDVSGASGFTPAAVTPTSLTWNVPATVPLGEGFGSIFVVNTDQGFTVSNTQYTHLFGDAEDNIPTITSVNGEALATTLDPGVPVAHSDTVITPGSIVTIGGSGFSVASGFGVSLFGADLDNPGAVKNYGPLFPLAGASATSFQIEIPPALPAGPANFRVTNFVGEDILSNSVSSVAVARPSITSVSVSGDTVTILGAGFSPLSVINLFNLQGSGVVNLGGLSGSTPNIPLTFVSDTELRFPRPTGAQSGPAFVEVLNPPYIPFSSSGNDAQGAFVFP
jgi:YVTN family beta-propeller protein